jgi:hypothetical protein
MLSSVLRIIKKNHGMNLAYNIHGNNANYWLKEKKPCNRLDMKDNIEIEFIFM